MGFHVKNYFSHKQENKIKAKEHTRLMELEFSEEIDSSISRSVVYGPKMPELPEAKDGNGPNFHLVSGFHQDYIHKADLSDEIVCVHNFSSYKNPGGMFINGSSAQEESLCHASTLYNVLSHMNEFYEWNVEHKNKGLYTDRAIYSPDIIFRFEEDTNIVSVNVDVLTCAAPNASLMRKYGAFTKEENDAALEHRVSFISRILDMQNVHTFITGAWGCGVFAQNPENVAILLHMYLQRTNIKDVYFVIPKGYQYDVFYKTLRRFLV
jgi:uncharacterized protein (TIGR02452 family)